MEVKSMLLGLLVLLFSLTGCSSQIVHMTPTGDIHKDLKGIASGDVHLYPVTVSPAIVKTKDGLTSLSQGWAPSSKAPASFVTDADIALIFAERSKQALQEAGYTVSYGPDAPSSAMLTLKQDVVAVLQNPTHHTLLNLFTVINFGFVATSSTPVSVVLVNTAFRNANGTESRVTIHGRGDSFIHLTKQSGFDRSMKFALQDYQKNLISSTRFELP